MTRALDFINDPTNAGVILLVLSIWLGWKAWDNRKLANYWADETYRVANIVHALVEGDESLLSPDEAADLAEIRWSHRFEKAAAEMFPGSDPHSLRSVQNAQVRAVLAAQDTTR